MLEEDVREVTTDQSGHVNRATPDPDYELPSFSPEDMSDDV